MKRVIRTIAAVAILFATTTGMANEPKLVTDGISKNLVFEWETQLSEATLKIVDTNGNTVYLDALDDVERYVKKFNLSHLKAGTYFLSLEDGTREFVYSIAVNKNNISILGMDESLKPAFREKEGSVYLDEVFVALQTKLFKNTYLGIIVAFFGSLFLAKFQPSSHHFIIFSVLKIREFSVSWVGV